MKTLEDYPNWFFLLNFRHVPQVEEIAPGVAFLWYVPVFFMTAHNLTSPHRFVPCILRTMRMLSSSSTR